MQKKNAQSRSFLLILVTYAAFVSLGLPDGLLGIAWPFMSERFTVPLDALGILLIGFVGGYLSTSTTGGKIMSIIPLGVLLSLSCFLTGLSLLAYAIAGYWWMVIIASYFLGAGGGAIDTSINTFAASRFSASVVNWLHGFYGVGATTGPLIMSWILSNDMAWYNGYLIVGVIQISLSIIFLLTLKYWKVSEEQEEEQISASYGEALRMPKVWLNILIFFIYTGLEVSVGQWIFTVLTRSREIAEADAGLWTSAYWGSFTLGRILFGFILTRLSLQKVLISTLVGIIAGTILLAIHLSNVMSLAGIILIGLANAPVFPSLISNTPKQIGKNHLANVIGFQISSAMVGGALLPAFAGWMMDLFTLEVIPKLFIAEAIFLLLLFLISIGMRSPISQDNHSQGTTSSN
ncbi:MFS transporter [Catalinimonas sp. 4WD22]|uniref:MFS transporter n=1 Tax=Catalinimonas locisalis TaxID=3133978 RepID=UPI0031018821